MTVIIQRTRDPIITVSLAAHLRCKELTKIDAMSKGIVRSVGVGVSVRYT